MSNKKENLLALISQGENAAIEFKSGQVRPDAVARGLVAFSNTLGGTLLIGVDDDGKISGMEIENFDEWIANISRNNVVPAMDPIIYTETNKNKKIGVIEVPKGIYKPYQTIDGRFWIRVGSTNRSATKEELSRLFQQAGLVNFDISPLERADMSCLDNDKLHNYWNTYYHIDYQGIEKSERENLLFNTDILVPFLDGNVVSVGGMLIFGKEPQKYLPQSAIIFAVFKGKNITDELVDKKEITGTLPDIIDNTASLIQLFLPKPSTINGLKREEKNLLPPKVIREALVNAVCHRDYSIINRKTMVYIFNDKIEITSPGKIANTLTVEKIKYGNSAIRNHFILKYLDNYRYIDGLGRGIPTIIKEMKGKVEITEIGELFKLTLNYVIK
ncbi:MAG: histidine kinase [Cytophagales bacterium]|nr:histidine kinase [Cytophagales bacterium]